MSFLQIFNLISSIESYKKVLISYPQFSDWQLVVTQDLIFSNFRIFKYICEYFLQIIFLFIFVTQGVKNNIHICIRIICLLQIIFIFVFVHQKNYSLHSATDTDTHHINFVSCMDNMCLGTIHVTAFLMQKLTHTKEIMVHPMLGCKNISISISIFRGNQSWF